MKSRPNMSRYDAGAIFSTLAAEKYLVNLEPKVCASRLAHYLSEINAIHPFREGNGRVQRLFISQLAEHAGYSLDYSSLDQAVLYPVMQASFLGNEQPLSDLIFKIIAWPLQASCNLIAVSNSPNKLTNKPPYSASFTPPGYVGRWSPWSTHVGLFWSPSALGTERVRRPLRNLSTANELSSYCASNEGELLRNYI